MTMSIAAAFKTGLQRVASAPSVLLGVAALTFLCALPLGLALRPMIADSLGASLAAHAAATGANPEWWQEFTEQAQGVGRAFTPATIGFAAVLDNLSSMADNTAHVTVVAASGVAYVFLWTFLVGGILDRYARGRATRSAGFFAASGVFFFRFLRLAVVAGAAYWLLFGPLHAWLFRSVYPALTREFTGERQTFAIRVALYLVFGASLALVNLLFDYAKVRAVVEDRRSMLGALTAAAGFLRRHPGGVVGLYLLDGLCFILVVAAYGMVAPGASAPLWWTLLAGQAYLLARLFVRLLFFASEVALFQRALAHSEYTAMPLPVWPDSPAAEAIVSGSRAHEA
jgi:hypothetical protein